MAHPFTAFDPNPDQVASTKQERRPATGTGNRCGHDPEQPRIVMPENPHTTQANQDAFGHNKKSRWFYDVTDTLNESYRFPRMVPLIGCIYKAHEYYRQHRSEAREADIAVMTALVHHMELASTNWNAGFSRVGRPTKDGFLYFDNKYWMEKTGLSASRLKRSFRRLKKAKYITRKRRWIERDFGKFKELATMTVINHSFFEAIEAMDGLRGAVDWASERLAKAAEDLGAYSHEDEQRFLRT